MQSGASFNWAEQLKWIVPTAIVVGGAAWRWLRPSCDAFFFMFLDGNPDRRDKSAREALATEIEKVDAHEKRLAEIEQMLEAHSDSLSAFEESLLAQGATLKDQITQVFDPLHRTLEKMEKALERIAHDTQTNSIQIGELRGLWDGSERRHNGGRRSGE